LDNNRFFKLHNRRIQLDNNWHLQLNHRSIQLDDDQFQYDREFQSHDNWKLHKHFWIWKLNNHNWIRKLNNWI